MSKRIYYLCQFIQKSPLRISSGYGDNTDVDLIRDSKGRPFIPGTSLTGVLRSLYDKDNAEILFGRISKKIKDDKGEEKIIPVNEDSKLLISDGVLDDKVKDSDYFISSRDGVGVDEKLGTAIKGAKFDFECVECSEPYYSVIELTDEEYEEDTDSLLGYIMKNGISLGGKTTRGYGDMKVTVKKKEFSFSEDLEKWLSFDAFDYSDYSKLLDVEVADNEVNQTIISCEIEMAGSFIVRVNTSAISEDAVPLSAHESGNPVIPGTSWAGSFRHHLLKINDAVKICESSLINDIFGKSKEKKKSQIRFNETNISGSYKYSYTRNVVDRFTGGTVEGALFTEMLARNGKGKLVITLSDKVNNKAFLELLGVALIDLDKGYFNVGGEGNVGRGLVNIKNISINDKDVTEQMKNNDPSFISREVLHA